MIKHQRKDTFTININEFATSSNGYDSKLPHPMNTNVIIKKDDNIISEMPLGNLITLMTIFEEMRCGGGHGPAMDKFFNALLNEHGPEAVTRACRVF